MSQLVLKKSNLIGENELLVATPKGFAFIGKQKYEFFFCNKEQKESGLRRLNTSPDVVKFLCDSFNGCKDSIVRSYDMTLAKEVLSMVLDQPFKSITLNENACVSVTLPDNVIRYYGYQEWMLRARKFGYLCEDFLLWIINESEFFESWRKTAALSVPWEY